MLGSRVSSRNSLSSFKKSLHVSKNVVPFAPEMPGQFFSQLKTCPKQSAFDSRNRNPECLGCVLRRQFFDVSQHENGAETWL